MQLYIFVLSFFTIPTTRCSDFDSCALKACHTLDPEKINVHLVPHSHDDVGWLKSVEDYYYGFNNEVQNVGVQYIFDSVLQALTRSPERRYIQVETAFFWKWWTKQTEKKRNLFKQFVDNGQIEMVGGGWSMNDEACVNYQSTINQFTWGLRLLNDSLGECGRPKIGWQIDPFGHSREQASIFKQLGYDAIFFVRLSQDDRDARKATKDLEFMWRSNDNYDSSEIFTSIMDSYYGPNDFCWDYLQCSSDAINDDPESFDYNLDKKVAEFSELIANYSSYFRTNNILYAMGGDFQYQAAQTNYLNMDRLIRGFANHSKYNVFYSTPSCYVEAVKKANVTFSVKEGGDFFPYNENAHTYWSGYYTSRSTLKRFERVGNSILQAAEQLNAFAKMRNITNASESEENVRSLREAMGTMQHHDAITGTEKETVAKDYARLLTEAIRKTEQNIGGIVGTLLKKDGVTEEINLPLSTCLLTNISVCENSMKDEFMVVVYNPLSRWVTHYVKLPVRKGSYTVNGPWGTEYSEINQHMDYPVKSPYTEGDVELDFTVKVPPMGMKAFYVVKTGDKFTPVHKELQKGETKTLGTGRINIKLGSNGHRISVKVNEKEEQINQNFMYYVSNNGSGDGISSGAYVFRPINGSSAYPVQNTLLTPSKILYREGLQMEIMNKYNDWLSQIVRIVYDEEEYLEYDWLVGPLDNDTV
ncbi:hypothetical protein JTB14_006632 [Gonioctena quinquepunctata]|nr:hypothetical protein JTB14_006632 [Gonioctena quinquepunctata]